MSAHLPPAPRLPELKPGLRIGPWRVLERVGRGGHGVVVRVVNADRPRAGSYALKLALEPGDARFEREAHLLSRVHHASVPRLEGRGTWKSPAGEAHPYLVMQWVEGLSMYAWAAEHGLTVRQAMSQLAQVARALEATHPHGVHRDVKGGNIRVSPEGHAVLLDFGSCKFAGASPLTGKELPPGTAPYRSPQMQTLEFALGAGAHGKYEFQPEDDVYSLGITAYRLLAGVYPPCDSGGTALPVAPRGLNAVCPELAALIERMLAEDPLERGSARQVAEQLEQLLEYARAELDEPWIANASRLPPEKAPPPTPRKDPLTELAPAFVVAGGFVLLGLLLFLMPRDAGRRGVAYAEPKPEQQRSDQADASTSVGEEALSSVTPHENVPLPERGVTRNLPSGPLDGQLRPPCTFRGALVLNGGCWWAITEAPCDPTMTPKLYEHEGRCYTPIFKGQRQPTSKDP